MKLHTNVVEKTSGLVFKKKYLEMSSQIELNEEEQTLVRAHPEVLKMTVASGRFTGNMEMDCSVGMLVKGMKESAFDSLADQTAFESSLREGCASLKGHFDRLREVGGAKTQEF
jgi:hypothetical protein